MLVQYTYSPSSELYLFARVDNLQPGEFLSCMLMRLSQDEDDGDTGLPVIAGSEVIHVFEIDSMLSAYRMFALSKNVCDHTPGMRLYMRAHTYARTGVTESFDRTNLRPRGTRMRYPAEITVEINTCMPLRVLDIDGPYTTAYNFAITRWMDEYLSPDRRFRHVAAVNTHGHTEWQFMWTTDTYYYKWCLDTLGAQVEYMNTYRCSNNPVVFDAYFEMYRHEVWRDQHTWLGLAHYVDQEFSGKLFVSVYAHYQHWMAAMHKTLHCGMARDVQYIVMEMLLGTVDIQFCRKRARTDLTALYNRSK